MILSKLYDNLVVRHWRPLAIFLVAIVLRVAYNALWLDHRICHFGDAFYYLTAGSRLLELITTSGSFSQAMSVLSAEYTKSASLMQSVLSLGLADRLVMDGPVYPAYLACMEFLCKINPAQPFFGSHCLALSVCNSIVDSLTCLLIYACGRLAFDRRTATIAGFVYALYPPAVINTQHCYTEQFASLLLYLWLTLIFLLCPRSAGFPARKFRNSTIACLATGVASALVMLVKPIFVLIPPAVAVLLLAVKRPSMKKIAIPIASCLIGLACIFVPWLSVTQSITGKATLFVSRAPSYNIYAGNQLNTDGWRVWPSAFIPGVADDAIAEVERQARQQPLKFVALELKKIPRLWAGVWNENQYSPLGVTVKSQDILHELLLLLGFTGFALVFARKKITSRSFLATSVLGVIVLVHFIYCAFEPISRYTMTAMPSLILLAAFAWATLSRSKNLNALLKVLAYSLILFWILHHKSIFIDLLSIVVPSTAVALIPWMDAIVWAIAWMVLGILVSNLILIDKQSARTSKYIVLACFAVVSLVSVSYSFTDLRWHEWSCRLFPNQIIRQELTTPNLAAGESPASTSFVLVDLSSPCMLPSITLTVNGHVEHEFPPLTWAQANTTSVDALQLLSIQGQAMGCDLRRFRQWWAFPVATRDLKFGGTNQITITADKNIHAPLPKIYGDYQVAASDKTAMLPSLKAFSWTKGFASIERGDPRIYEPIVLNGKASSLLSNGCHWSSGDLSSSFGRQFGTYRIRLAVPCSYPTANKSSVGAALVPPASTRILNEKLQASAEPPTVLVPKDSPRRLVGSDPTSMILTPQPIKLPANLPSGSIFSIQTELKNAKPNGTAYVSVDFRGTDNGKPVSWNSVWQPASISTGTDWRPASFADVIPDNILNLKDLHVTVMVSPFHPDLLYMKQKLALKQTGEVRNVVFSIYPSLGLPPSDQTKWIIY